MFQGVFMHLLIAGAGLSGATMARVLAEAGHRVTVIEKLSHVAGHCFSQRDRSTGIMVHQHGPHIFHTDRADVRSFVERFARFQPFEHSVTANVQGRQFPLPITLNTLEAFFDRELDEQSAEELVKSLAVDYGRAPLNFEEQGRSMLGDQLYEAFFDGYTRKQWGRDPSELPACVIKRLPVRFTRNQSYFNHTFVAMPEDGYTALTESMLDHPSIRLQLGSTLGPDHLPAGYDHVVFTGPLDEWFGHEWGRLPYRSLRFEQFEIQGTHQKTAVNNYNDVSVPHTRITEHKHFEPWNSFDRSILSREYSFECGPGDTPYYPVNLARGSALLDHYMGKAGQLKGVSFVGRLASFRYLDMDQAIGEALEAAANLIEADGRGAEPAVFPHLLGTLST
jgi:UDP-galactopyranose mutase